jgi:hypothetical protein
MGHDFTEHERRREQNVAVLVEPEQKEEQGGAPDVEPAEEGYVEHKEEYDPGPMHSSAEDIRDLANE